MPQTVAASSDRVRFVHVPRTGGMSLLIGWHLQPPEYFQHIPLHLTRYERFEPPTFVYGGVRNPFDRVVSLYMSHRASEPFRDWLRVRYVQHTTGEVHPCDSMRPALYWLAPAHFVYRFESYSDDIARLSELLGREMPQEHRGATEHGPYQDFYDPESRAWVEELHADDLSAFGYRFD